MARGKRRQASRRLRYPRRLAPSSASATHRDDRARQTTWTAPRVAAPHRLQGKEHTIIMKGLRVIALGLLVALGGIPTARAAAAQPCPAGCGLQKSACLHTGRLSMLACKQDCRANAEPTALGTCVRACMTTSRSDKTGCQSDHVTCLGSCQPPSPPPGPPPSGCLGSCGQELAACAKGVVAQAKTCVAGCRTASVPLGCFKGCIATAKQGGAACGAGFQTCEENCASSPSGAFVE